MRWNGNAEGFIETFARADVGDEQAFGESLRCIPDADWRRVRPRLEQRLHQKKISRLRTARPFFGTRASLQELVSLETKERLLMMERLRRDGTPVRSGASSPALPEGAWATVGTDWPWRS